MSGGGRVRRGWGLRGLAGSFRQGTVGGGWGDAQKVSDSKRAMGSSSLDRIPRLPLYSGRGRDLPKVARQNLLQSARSTPGQPSKPSCTRGSLAVQRREKCPAPGLQRLPPLGALVMGHLLETPHRLAGFRSVTRVLRPSGTLVPVRSPDLSGRVFIVTAKDPIIESIGYK